MSNIWVIIFLLKNTWLYAFILALIFSTLIMILFFLVELEKNNIVLHLYKRQIILNMIVIIVVGFLSINLIPLFNFHNYLIMIIYSSILLLLFLIINWKYYFKLLKFLKIVK